MSVRFIFELVPKLSHITFQLLYVEDWLIIHLFVFVPLLLHFSQHDLAMIIDEWEVWVVEISDFEVGRAHAIVFWWLVELTLLFDHFFGDCYVLDWLFVLLFLMRLLFVHVDVSMSGRSWALRIRFSYWSFSLVGRVILGSLGWWGWIVVDEGGDFFGCSYFFIAVLNGDIGIISVEWTLIVYVFEIGYLYLRQLLFLLLLLLRL